MTELRRQTRFTVNLDAQLIHRGERAACRIHNMSQGGAFLGFAIPLPMGTTVTLSFRLPLLDEAVEVEAVVRWHTSDGLGVQFGGFRAKESWALGKYFERLGEP